MLRLLPFVVAPMLPAALLLVATVHGAPWAVAGILMITVVVFFLDKVSLTQSMSAHEGHTLSTLLGLVHFALLGTTLWAMNGPLGLLDKSVLVVGCGLYFGQISNSNAHELIHRKDRWAFRLGGAIYASLLFGHHTSAHRLVHHIHVATPNDPASAPGGMGFWAYLPRAWLGSFRAGLRAERQRHYGVRWPAPYIGYVLGALISLFSALIVGAFEGVAALLIMAFYAQLQLMLSDYVQHYGLTRQRLPDGTYEPTGPAHSWNAPQWYSSAMMLNAPRHSAHHKHPTLAFPQLELNTQTMPILPHSLPVMAIIALFPPLWRRSMDSRVGFWRRHVYKIHGEMMPAAS